MIITIYRHSWSNIQIVCKFTSSLVWGNSVIPFKLHTNFFNSFCVIYSLVTEQIWMPDLVSWPKYWTCPIIIQVSGVFKKMSSFIWAITFLAVLTKIIIKCFIIDNKNCDYIHLEIKKNKKNYSNRELVETTFVSSHFLVKRKETRLFLLVPIRNDKKWGLLFLKWLERIQTIQPWWPGVLMCDKFK